MRDVVLCHPVRTAIGSYGGSLKVTTATEFGAAAFRETLLRSGLDPGGLGSVTMGNVVQAGNRMNSTRQAAVDEGVSVSVAEGQLALIAEVAKGSKQPLCFYLSSIRLD